MEGGCACRCLCARVGVCARSQHPRCRNIMMFCVILCISHTSAVQAATALAANRLGKGSGGPVLVGAMLIKCGNLLVRMRYTGPGSTCSTVGGSRSRAPLVSITTYSVRVTNQLQRSIHTGTDGKAARGRDAGGFSHRPTANRTPNSAQQMQEVPRSPAQGKQLV